MSTEETNLAYGCTAGCDFDDEHPVLNRRDLPWNDVKQRTAVQCRRCGFVARMMIQVKPAATMRYAKVRGWNR